MRSVLSRDAWLLRQVNTTDMQEYTDEEERQRNFEGSQDGLPIIPDSVSVVLPFEWFSDFEEGKFHEPHHDEEDYRNVGDVERNGSVGDFFHLVS